MTSHTLVATCVLVLRADVHDEQATLFDPAPGADLGTALTEPLGRYTTTNLGLALGEARFVNAGGQPVVVSLSNLELSFLDGDTARLLMDTLEQPTTEVPQ